MVGHPSSIVRPSSVHTLDQLYLHSLQADLHNFSPIAYIWLGIVDINFSGKSNEKFGCYDKHKVPSALDRKVLVITVTHLVLIGFS